MHALNAGRQDNIKSQNVSSDYKFLLQKFHLWTNSEIFMKTWSYKVYSAALAEGGAAVPGKVSLYQQACPTAP